jgi:hypothetical protein
MFWKIFFMSYGALTCISFALLLVALRSPVSTETEGEKCLHVNRVGQLEYDEIEIIQ